MKDVCPSQLFETGHIVATMAALSALESAGISADELLLRHVSGDWGDLCPEDMEANEVAVTAGYRLLSRYPLESGATIWIITEWDRSVTTLLLPGDY